ncbi:MAG: LytTR family transcriptional regulator [Lewinellaceae bacterium]|nr:LytTR family transcriptional regulator [Lewinellaceae bacterium]
MGGKLEQTGGFLRIHKQYIVNLSQVIAKPAYNLLQVNGTQLPVGRTYQGRVADRIRV